MGGGFLFFRDVDVGVLEDVVGSVLLVHLFLVLFQHLLVFLRYLAFGRSVAHDCQLEHLLVTVSLFFLGFESEVERVFSCGVVGLAKYAVGEFLILFLYQLIELFAFEHPLLEKPLALLLGNLALLLKSQSSDFLPDFFDRDL